MSRVRLEPVHLANTRLDTKDIHCVGRILEQPVHIVTTVLFNGSVKTFPSDVQTAGVACGKLIAQQGHKHARCCLGVTQCGGTWPHAQQRRNKNIGSLATKENKRT
jgi:hypothetical protein